MDSKELTETIANLVDYNCEGCILPKTISCTHPCAQEYYVAKKIMARLAENCWLKTDPCINCPDKVTDAYGLFCILTCGKDLTQRKPIEVKE